MPPRKKGIASHLENIFAQVIFITSFMSFFFEIKLALLCYQRDGLRSSEQGRRFLQKLSSFQPKSLVISFTTKL